MTVWSILCVITYKTEGIKYCYVDFLLKIYYQIIFMKDLIWYLTWKIFDFRKMWIWDLSKWFQCFSHKIRNFSVKFAHHCCQHAARNYKEWIKMSILLKYFFNLLTNYFWTHAIQQFHVWSNLKKFSPMWDRRLTPLEWLSSTCDLDLNIVLGHTVYGRASVIDLYVHTKCPWNRKKRYFLDGLTTVTPTKFKVTWHKKLGQISKIRPHQI